MIVTPELHGLDGLDHVLAFDRRVQVLPISAWQPAALDGCGAILLCGADGLSTNFLNIVRRIELEANNRYPPVPVLNSRSTVMRRLEQLRVMFAAGINNFQAWRIGLDDTPTAYPLFLRYDGPQGEIVSDLIATPQGLRAQLVRLGFGRSVPTDLLAVQWWAGRGEDDLYRKYSAFVIGNEVIPAHLRLSNHWNVRSRTSLSNSAADAEEQQYMATNPHRQDLLRAARACGMDFARVDYAVVEARVQIFEFNLNPVIIKQRDVSSPSKKAVAELVATALESLVK